MPPKVAEQSTLWLKAWDAVQGGDSESAQDTVLDIIEGMHPKVVSRLLCRAPAQRASSYLSQFAERDPTVAAEILTWMGSLTTNISYLSQRFLEQDVQRAYLLREVAGSTADDRLLQSSTALMGHLREAYGVQCTFMRLPCDWDTSVDLSSTDAAREIAAADAELRSLNSTRLNQEDDDSSSDDDSDDSDGEDEGESMEAGEEEEGGGEDAAAAAAAIAAAAAADGVSMTPSVVKYNASGLGIASEDNSTAAYQELEAEDALNLLHTTEWIHVRTGEIPPSNKPRMVVDASVLLRASKKAVEKRSPVAVEGIYVVPVLNQHGVAVAVVSSFDSNYACDSCECGQPAGYVYAKTVQSLKLFAVAVGLAAAETAATARELRRKSRKVKLVTNAVKAVQEISAEPERLQQYKTLLHGYQDQRRKIALKILLKKEIVRTSLGEIKRYRKPPGIVANVIVALLVSVGDVDVTREVNELGGDVIRWKGRHAKRKTASKDELASLSKAWDKLWHVARRQVQLQYQHPAFILRRMQEMSRDITSTETMQDAQNKVDLDALRTLLDGVSSKKVRKASDVATIIFKWVSAHLNTIEVGGLKTLNPKPGLYRLNQSSWRN
jgi:hypothetical protein